MIRTGEFGGLFNWASSASSHVPRRTKWDPLRAPLA